MREGGGSEAQRRAGEEGGRGWSDERAIPDPRGAAGLGQPPGAGLTAPSPGLQGEPPHSHLEFSFRPGAVRTLCCCFKPPGLR